MKTESDNAIPRLDIPASNALLNQLAHETARVDCGAIGGHDICEVWAEPNCILFRLVDGRRGSVEVLVNSDVVYDALHDVNDVPTRLAAPA